MGEEFQSSAYIAYASQCPSTCIQPTALPTDWLQRKSVGDKAWLQTLTLQCVHVPPKPPQVIPTTAEHDLRK